MGGHIVQKNNCYEIKSLKILKDILETLQKGKDYEEQLVRDDEGTIWLEVRIFSDNNTQILYFLPGSNTPGNPVLPIEYDSSTAYLTSLLSVLTGTQNTPITLQNTNAGEDTETMPNVRAFSLIFEGTGGQINGIDVPSGYIVNKSAQLSNILISEPYKVPDTADPNQPFSPRVVISYIV